MPRIVTSPTSLARHWTSDSGVGKPDESATARASGRPARTASYSARVITGRRETRFHASSSKKPIWIGTRRTWNALLPMSEFATFSFTYAFIPWITATTAPRKATDTMIPRSVKKLRSLLARISASAVKRTSSGSMSRREGEGECGARLDGWQRGTECDAVAWSIAFEHERRASFRRQNDRSRPPAPMPELRLAGDLCGLHDAEGALPAVRTAAASR